MLAVRQDRLLAGLAIGAALCLHAWLLGWLLQQHVDVVRRPPPEMIMVLPPQILPKPKPKPVPVVKKIVVPRPVVKPLLVPQPVKRIIPHAAAKPSPPPVMHFNAAPPVAGLGLDIGTPPGGTGDPGVIAAYDDSVKQRIIAAKTYPPALKGMWNQCVVSYRVTVDRSGALLDYKIYGCGNPFLDAAAAAAVLKASPYPVPPDFGGTRYDVFGSLIFTQKEMRP